MSVSAPWLREECELPALEGSLVSVLVPVRNGREDLRILLEALSAQTPPPERFEIDDGSTDGSKADLPTDDGWVRVLSAEPIISYAARNRAADAARAPILAFSDADCQPDVHWLERGTCGPGANRLIG